MNNSRISSRLAKRQQSQMLRQTILYVVAAIVLGVAFIFFILPRTINLFFTLTSGTQEALTASPGLPPQVPVFSAPPLATSSAVVALSGFGSPKSEITLVVNGNQANSETVADDGTFTIEVTLDEGENQVTAFAKNDTGAESEISRSYTIVKDTQNPSLEITAPQEGQSIELRRNQVTAITGKTEPGSQLLLNDRSIYVNGDGSFSSSYQLQEGENTLKFVARDQAGNETQKELKVTFKF